jgi:hypothetical protein
MLERNAPGPAGTSEFSSAAKFCGLSLTLENKPYIFLRRPQ